MAPIGAVAPKGVLTTMGARLLRTGVRKLTCGIFRDHRERYGERSLLGLNASNQGYNDHVVDRLIDYLVWSAPLIGMLLGAAVVIIVDLAWKLGRRACQWLVRRFAATPAVPERKRPATPSPLRDNLVDGNTVVAYLDAVLAKGLRLDGMDPNGRARLLIGSMPRNWEPRYPSARAAGHFMAKHLDYDKQAIPVLERLAGHQEAERLDLRVRLAVPQLHAKLYAWTDAQRREGALIGSSNLTRAGLNDQGELNVVVEGGDVQLHAHAWFDARWNEQAAYPVGFSDALSALHESISTRPGRMAGGQSGSPAPLPHGG
ncbi:MAG: NgoFVII family restriction endonuclease [Caldilineaceae bacterium SB0664_bin_22]|nr:NgoFVII family restriction endonuclease [Caldilineaceae bacterium SB0664_bin_22]